LRVKIKQNVSSLFKRGCTEFEVEADTLEDIKKLLEIVDKVTFTVS